MDRLKQSAIAFEKLLDKEYHIKLGTPKKIPLEFKILFAPIDFKHLSGVQHLTDTAYARMAAEDFFSNILTEKTTESDLHNSIYFNDIETRLENLANLEYYLDNNMLVFKWDSRQAKSNINANYLFKENTDEENKAYVFVKEK